MTYSTEDEARREGKQEAAPDGGASQAQQPTEDSEAHPYSDFSREELSGMLLERDGALANCNVQVQTIRTSHLIDAVIREHKGA